MKLPSGVKANTLGTECTVVPDVSTGSTSAEPSAKTGALRLRFPVRPVPRQMRKRHCLYLTGDKNKASKSLGKV